MSSPQIRQSQFKESGVRLVLIFDKWQLVDIEVRFHRGHTECSPRVIHFPIYNKRFYSHVKFVAAKLFFYSYPKDSRQHRRLEICDIDKHQFRVQAVLQPNFHILQILYTAPICFFCQDVPAKVFLQGTSPRRQKNTRENYDT